MSLETTLETEGLQVENFDLCLHIVMVTAKCTDVFRGIFLVERRELRGLGYVVHGYFHGGASHGGTEFQ